nr:IS66 family insertion sequence hypothetical protein [Vibrio anguillarum]
GFVKAEVVEKTTKYQATVTVHQSPIDNQV